MGYLSGVLQGGTLNEQIARGLQGAMQGSQADILGATREDALKMQRAEQAALLPYLDQLVKAKRITPEQARVALSNPEYRKELGKQIANPTTAIHGDTMYINRDGQMVPRAQNLPAAQLVEGIRPDGSPMKQSYFPPARSPLLFDQSGAPQGPPGPQAAPQAPPQVVAPQGPQAGPPLPVAPPGVRGPVSPAAPAVPAIVSQQPRATGGELVPGGFTGNTIPTGLSPSRVKEEEAGGTALAAQDTDIQKNAVGAMGMLGTLRRIGQLNLDPNLPQGQAGPVFNQIRSTLASFGIDPKSAATGEELDAINKKLILDGLNGSLGAGVSNADTAIIAGQNPTLEKTKAAREEVIKTMTALAERKIAVLKLAEAYKTDPKLGNGSLRGFTPYLAQWAERPENQMFAGRGAASSTSGPAPMRTWNRKTGRME
jgi:hypothetical protein